MGDSITYRRKLIKQRLIIIKGFSMKMKLLRFVLVFVLLFNITSFSYGWGKVGHHIIVEVAKDYISKNVQDSVTKYLGDMTWESASTWMDELRGDAKYDYMKKWHYINIDKGNHYDTTIENGNNVVKQLEIAISNLKNKSKLTKEEINLNIKVLFHLMGDLHQPLHVGYGNDRGGNDVKVTYNAKVFNLHRIWDTDVIESQKNTTENVLDLLSKTSHRKLKKMAKGDIVQWFDQTRVLLDLAYTYPDVISDEYINKCYPVIENQLLLGGVRLGKILNEVFKN
jgi:hypothetical protein